MQQDNVVLSNFHALNAMLYTVEHSCQRQALPKRLVNWQTTNIRMSHWIRADVLDRVFGEWQRNSQIDRTRI